MSSKIKPNYSYLGFVRFSGVEDSINYPLLLSYYANTNKVRIFVMK